MPTVMKKERKVIMLLIVESFKKMNNGNYVYKLIPVDTTKEIITLTGGTAVAKFLDTNNSKVSKFLNVNAPVNGYFIRKEGVELVKEPVCCSDINVERDSPRKYYQTKDKWHLRQLEKDTPTLAVIKTFRLPQKFVEWEELDMAVKSVLKGFVDISGIVEKKHIIYTTIPENKNTLARKHLYEIQFYFNWLEEKNIKEKYEDIRELLGELNNLIKNYAE